MGSCGLASRFPSFQEICRGTPGLGNQAAFNRSLQASPDVLRVCPVVCTLAGPLVFMALAYAEGGSSQQRG